MQFVLRSTECKSRDHMYIFWAWRAAHLELLLLQVWLTKKKPNSVVCAVILLTPSHPLFKKMKENENKSSEQEKNWLQHNAVVVLHVFCSGSVDTHTHWKQFVLEEHFRNFLQLFFNFFLWFLGYIWRDSGVSLGSSLRYLSYKATEIYGMSGWNPVQDKYHTLCAKAPALKGKNLYSTHYDFFSFLFLKKKKHFGEDTPGSTLGSLLSWEGSGNHKLQWDQTWFSCLQGVTYHKTLSQALFS